MRILIRLLISAAALWVADLLIDGIQLDTDNWLGVVIVVLVFGLVNAFIRPVIKLLSLPVLILTLGLFTLVINAALLGLTAALTDALSIDGFWAALLGALVVSVVSALLSFLVPDD